MCGFAGFVAGAGGAGQVERPHAVLRAMGEQLSRRGPDDEQVLVDGALALVFRRLAIVDLPGGRQPIANEDGTVFVAVNGEIYNHADLRRSLTRPHRFRSASDAEVVLHLFEERGTAALDLLIGMFAVAIWDARAGRLLLARDRLGIKPLYYACTPSGLLFASELKALLAHPACPREFAWHDLHHAPGRLPTYVRGVEALAGGQFLAFGPSGQPDVRTYWSLDSALAREDEGAPAAHYVDAYADLFDESVRLRLMADVPVGVFLSGGLDSAALAAVAARHGSPLPCFTMIEQGGWSCGDAAAAGDLAARMGSPFFPVLFDHRTLADEIAFGLEDLEYFVWLMDLPTFTLEFLFKHELHRFARTAIPDLKVMLIGQGADEFAGGYSNSAWEPHAGWEDYLARTVVPLWRSQRQFACGVPEMFKPALAPGALGPVPAAPFKEEMRYRLHTLQIFNLWHEDRTSAGQGIEARVPYLDHRLVELLASVPGRLHAELFWDKAILRRAARRWLPEPFTLRAKVPFVYGPNRQSTVDLALAVVTSVFPAFREKYLVGDDALWDATLLARLLRYAGTHPDRRENVVNSLLACMGISIFTALCARPPASAPAALRAPSPLRLCDPAHAPWEAQRI